MTTSIETVNKAREWVSKLSTSLVDRYEVNSLQGEKLTDILMGFDLVEIKLKKAQKVSRVSTFFFWVIAAVLFYALLSSVNGKIPGNMTLFFTCSLVAWVAGVGNGFVIIMGNVQNRYRNSQHEIAKKLTPFIIACESLKSPVGRTEHSFTMDSVKDNFVTHAVRILEAEKNLDEVRMLPEVVFWELANKVSWLQRVREKSDDAFFTLNGCFGIKFDNKELFADAKKHLERSYGK